MSLRKGVTVRIGYVIEGYTDKIGKNRESKKTSIFRKLTKSPSQSPFQDKSSNSGANNASGGSDLGRRLAIHGFVNGLLAAGENPSQVMAALPDLLNLEDAIDEALASKTNDLGSDEMPEF
jgi:hypothetical protein